MKQVIKKIGILTQPLHDNYGGLLQAFALRKVVESLGKEVIIIDRRPNVSKMRRLLSTFKSKALGRRVNPKSLITKKQQEIISKETYSFRLKYIPLSTHVIQNNNDIKLLNRMGFDAYIVGSDQSWRPKYSPKISNYFLDFASNEESVRRISYAVSFGVSDWEFNDEETKTCRRLLEKFDAISVREDTAVELVKKHLGRDDAIHLVDPTMLLSTDVYNEIAIAEKSVKSNGDLKVYVLDKTESKSNFIHSVEQRLNLTSFEVLPLKRIGSEPIDDKNVISFSYPNPAQWLRGFQDAKFVITDSFHGTVFSILYNKPFLTIGNTKRGMARFESLLNMFNLEKRLIQNLDDPHIDILLAQPIDWYSVNKILEVERQKAKDFLKKNLS